jgi:small neutral amino acid transporter SnatA (MarC family)
MAVLIKVMGLFTLAIGVQFIASGASTILSRETLKMGG